MYKYEEMKPKLLSQEGFTMLLKIRDHTKSLIETVGCARLQEIINCTAGDSWMMIACVDFMLERGEIREITKPSDFTQHRVFVKA